MARGKRRPVNLTREEFNEEAGIASATEFNRIFERLHDMYGPYGVKQDSGEYYAYRKVQDNEDSALEFVLEWYPLLKVLMSTLPAHPLYRKNADETGVTVRKITEYYDDLFKAIEAMPVQLRFEIQGHAAYQKAVKERAILPKLALKIAETIEAIERLTKQERPDIMGQIHLQLDNWVYNAFRKHYLERHAVASNRQVVDRMVTEAGAKNIQDRDILRRLLEEDEEKSSHASISELDLFLAKTLKDRMSKIRERDEAELDAEVSRYWRAMGLLPKTEGPSREQYHMYYEMIGVPAPQAALLESLIQSLSHPKVLDNTQERRAVQFLNEQAQLNEDQHKSQRLAAKERYIQSLEDKIVDIEQEIAYLRSKDDFLYEETELENQMLQEYLEFCKDIHSGTQSEYRGATDSFLGQLMARYFIRGQ